MTRFAGVVKLGSMDIAETAENFRRATLHCDNLVAVHQRSGGSERGFRDEEVSVNRAIVVLTVASWQTVIQDLTLACVDVSAPAVGGALSPQSYAVLAGRVRQEVGDFATPNAQNTRRLMVGAGFDPRPHWTWAQVVDRGSDESLGRLSRRTTGSMNGFASATPLLMGIQPYRQCKRCRWSGRQAPLLLATRYSA
jgi:hypothetical protein